MISADIKRVIEIIEQRINSLEQIKKMLLDEFGLDSPMQRKGILKPKRRVVKKTRKDVIIKLLLEEGPFSSKEIRNRTGFPKGTINYVLYDKQVFSQKDGKWNLVSKEEVPR